MAIAESTDIAYERAYEAHWSDVFRFALAWTNDWGSAEDLAQEAYLRLWNDLGFTGVTITDSLNGTAAARSVSVRSLAVRAARAGTDMILVTGSETSTAVVFATLLNDAGAGTISRTTLRTSYARILALKTGL